MFFFFALLVSLSAFANDTDNGIEWEVGFHKEKNDKPKEWYSAIVPGAVQLDYAKAKGWEDHMFGENWKDYRWMEDVYWTYKTKDERGVEYDFIISQLDCRVNDGKIREGKGYIYDNVKLKTNWPNGKPKDAFK